MEVLSQALLFAALLPPAALLVYIYRQDKVEKEPPRLLLRLFAGGALAVLPAALWEYLAARWLLALPPQNPGRILLLCFAAVALAEEGCKWLALRALSWRDPAFNYRFDGLVYAVFVSMGFAVVENLRYVLGGGGFCAAALRAVTAIPGHAAFAVFMGFYYGSAKRCADAALRCADASRAATCRRLARRCQLRALWQPLLLHGLYDLLLARQSPWMSGAFAAFVLLLLLSALRQVRTAGQHDLPA